MLEKEGDLFGETRSKIDRVYVPEMALAAARTYLPASPGDNAEGQIASTIRSR